MDTTRTFCIIAHIDHGKSTLADRLIQATAAPWRPATSATRSSTTWRSSGSAASPSRATASPLGYTARDGRTYELNLLDTPGHVDFSHEVRRSLMSCEGALLLVDASQGVEAQTVANLYLALEYDLELVPVINKIDLPAADVERVRAEIEEDLGLDADACGALLRQAGQRHRRRARGGRPPPAAAHRGPCGAAHGPHLRRRVRPLPWGGAAGPG